MGAKKGETTATERGHDIDVKVQGAMGTENELSAEATEAADAVIIAADTSVSRDRFEVKPLVKDTIKAAVNDPDGLIDEAIENADGDADTADSDTDREGTEDTEPEPAETPTDDESTEQTEPSETSNSGGLLGAIRDSFSYGLSLPLRSVSVLVAMTRGIVNNRLIPHSAVAS